MESLEQWLEREYPHAVTSMLPSLSAVGIVKQRPGFGQTMVPKPGSIVASPVLASYDPDPDYFFHWFRDSAVIVDSLRLLLADGSVGSEQALQYFGDFVRFSLGLLALDGSALVAAPGWRRGVAPDFEKFVRPDSELGTLRGDSIAAEARVNPDGTLDISKWARPQHDGPPLRLLAVLRWIRTIPLDPALAADAAALVRADIAFTRGRWRLPSIDIWEEEKGLHYYTLRISAAALKEGAGWLDEQGAGKEAQQCRADAAEMLRMLDGFWLPEEGYFRSRVLESGARSTKELDIAVIFAAIHGAGDEPTHSIRDPRMHATLARLEALFTAEYPINRDQDRARGPAMGRYSGDVYYSGGAYYFATLAAAEFCFRAAAVAGGATRAVLFEHGDAFLETVRAFTPPSGDLSEQFDQKTGAQTSARHLAWSYAALISSVAARRLALRVLQ